MARTQSKVQSLVDEDPEMRVAVETVLDRAEDGTVRWVDVRDDVSSGQWGRLIERGVLVDGEEGFELADPEATREAVEDADGGAVADSAGTEDVDMEGSSWSIYDKAAAVLMVPFFVAYQWQPLREIIGGVVNVVLGPLEQVLPFYAVVMVLALATGLYSTILQANLMNTEKMAAFQERMKDIKDRRQEAKDRGDEEALDRIQEEQMDAMGDQIGMFKEQFRPMVWIMFLTIPVFLWMYWKVGIGDSSAGQFGTIVVPLKGQVAWKESLVGPIQVWIVWYFICSMGFTQIIRKGLNLDISPTG
ncbi:MAG: DUF106 domain-containing protein [Haloferacaceae archaeon]